MKTKRRRQFRPSTEQLEKRELLTVEVTTTMLADFSPGEASSEFEEFETSGDLLFFDVNESELWQTDGTPSGTRKLADVNRVGNFLEAGDLRLFNVVTDEGQSIWRTDGTPEGTFELVPRASISNRASDRFVSGRAEAVRVGDQIFFATFVGETYRDDSWDLYRSDGTREGTQLISDDYRRSLVATSDSAFYVNQSQTISVIQGLDTEPQQLSLPVPGGWFDFRDSDIGQTRLWVEPRDEPQLYVANDRLVFTTTRTDGSVRRPRSIEVTGWSSDGTERGTQPLAQEQGLRGEGLPINDSGWAQLDDQLVIPFSNGTFLSTDGTVEGTNVLPYEGPENVIFLGELNGRAYFRFYTVPEQDSFAPISSTDGVSFRQELPSLFNFVSKNDESFTIRSGDSSFSNFPQELLLLDDTNLTDLRIPVVEQLIGHSAGNVGNTWYFQGFEYGADAPQIFAGRMDTSDGIGTELPSFGTFLTGSTSSVIGDGTIAESLLAYPKPHEAPLFTLDDGSLFALDGGFSREFIAAGLSVYHYDAAGLFYFTTPTLEFGSEVWVSDGTAEGTTVIDLYEGPTSSSPTLLNWDGRTLVTALTPENGTELWVIGVDDVPPNMIVETDDYSIVQGNDLTLQATAFGTDEEFLYSWDLNGNGTFDIENAEATLTIPWDELTTLAPAIGPGLHNLTVRAVGQRSGESFTDTAALHVRDSRQIWVDLPRQREVGTNEIQIRSFGSNDQMEFALLSTPWRFGFDRDSLDLSDVNFQPSATFDWPPGTGGSLLAVARDRLTGELFFDARHDVSLDPLPQDVAIEVSNLSVELNDAVYVGSNELHVSATSAGSLEYELEIQGPTETLRIEQNDSNFSFSLEETGEFTFTVTVRAGTSTETWLARRIVRRLEDDAALISDNPQLVHVGEQSATERADFDLIATPIGLGNDLVYSWDINDDGTTEVVTNEPITSLSWQTISDTFAGVQNDSDLLPIRLTVDDNATGETFVGSGTLVVENVAPEIIGIDQTDSATVEQPTSFTVVANDANSLQYQLTFLHESGLVIATGLEDDRTFEIEFPLPGTYEQTATVVDSRGAATTESDNLSVSQTVFRSSVPLDPSESQHTEALLADFDGDGWLDAFVATQDGPDQIYLNDRFGFPRLTDQALGDGLSVYGDVGDIDADGDVDVVVSGERSVIWLNDGKGNFTDNRTIDVLHSTQDAKLSDLDADGDLDIVFATTDEATGIVIYLNNGGSSFVLADTIAINSPVTSIELGDIDNDGDTDVVYAADGGFGFALNNGAGIFDDAFRELPIFDELNKDFDNFEASDIFTGDVEVGDVDGDGDLDIVHGSGIQGQGSNVLVWKNDGNGNFTNVAQRLRGLSNDLVLVDLDNDRDLDMLGDRIWINDGNGHFSFADQFDSATRTLAIERVAVGDLDRDGDVDVFAALRESKNRIYRNQLLHETGIPGDTNGDGTVGFLDFLILLSNFNFGATEKSRGDGDFNGDSKVDFADFLILSHNFAHV